MRTNSVITETNHLNVIVRTVSANHINSVIYIFFCFQKIRNLRLRGVIFLIWTFKLK